MEGVCLCCGENGPITKHHVIPRTMRPLNNSTIMLCYKCHQKLNSLYVRHPNLTTSQLPADFKEFRVNYEELRKKFYDRQLTNGEFGEALWTNLVNYLELISEAKKE